MMRSMYSGVSGLRVHQTKMDVIGNNIANVNTSGYKAQRVTFGEVFSQTIQSASAASDTTGKGGSNAMQVGLGVNVSSIDILMTQGAAQRTDNPFDLMINGDGFIVVSDNTGTYFTRSGALRQDELGNLVTPNGMKVQGWPATEDGLGINQGEVQDIQFSSANNMFAPPQATTEVLLEGNLNIQDGIIAEDGTGGITTTIKMYDSLGNIYTTPVKMTYNEADREWTMAPQLTEDGDMILTNINMQDDAGTAGIIENKYAIPNPFQDATGAGIEEISMTFDANGNIETVGDGTELGVRLGAIDFTTAREVIVDPETKQHIAGENIKGLNATAGNLAISLTGMTQYQSKTDIDSTTVDGRAAGEMMGYDVAGDGKITAYYNNGETRLLGQIVVANFENPTGLEKVGDNLFKTTVNSGDFDQIGAEGSFQAGVLEMSNVDLASEFTEMITTQRGYQASSRIITVSDEMIQELVNLKR